MFLFSELQTTKKRQIPPHPRPFIFYRLWPLSKPKQARLARSDAHSLARPRPPLAKPDTANLSQPKPQANRPRSIYPTLAVTRIHLSLSASSTPLLEPSDSHGLVLCRLPSTPGPRFYVHGRPQETPSSRSTRSRSTAFHAAVELTAEIAQPPALSRSTLSSLELDSRSPRWGLATMELLLETLSMVAHLEKT